MKQKLIEVLNTICPKKVYLQGTFNSDVAYPKSFITFWTNYTDDVSFYDDEVSSIEWDFSVIFYSSDPSLVATKPIEIINALKQVGFIPQGRGQDIPSDKASHTGWSMEFIYKEFIKGE